MERAYRAGQSQTYLLSKLGVRYVRYYEYRGVNRRAFRKTPGFYCTGRVRSMSMGVPRRNFMAKMSRQHVPYAGILATLVVHVVGVF